MIYLIIILIYMILVILYLNDRQKIMRDRDNIIKIVQEHEIKEQELIEWLKKFDKQYNDLYRKKGIQNDTRENRNSDC